MSENSKTTAEQRRSNRERRRRGRTATPADGRPGPDGAEQDAPRASLGADLLRRAASPAVLGAAAGAAAAARLARPQPATRQAEAREGTSGGEDDPANEADDAPSTTATVDGMESDHDAEPSDHRPETLDGDAPADERPLGSDDQTRLVRRARGYAEALAGRESDSVSAIGRGADGWQIVVEVVEVPRIPSTTDVLASYELRLDDDGDLLEYRRLRRYYRNVASEDQGL